MKIHNYGNDYVFQHRQKKETERRAPVQQIVKLQNELTKNVEHQIQAEGEAAMAAVNQCTESESEDIPAAKKAPRKRKKRKEEILDTQSAPEES